MNFCGWNKNIYNISWTKADDLGIKLVKVVMSRVERKKLFIDNKFCIFVDKATKTIQNLKRK